MCGCMILGCSPKSLLENQLSNSEIETLIATPTSNSALENFIEDINVNALPLVF